jgi:hypothetical protein
VRSTPPLSTCIVLKSEPLVVAFVVDSGYQDRSFEAPSENICHEFHGVPANLCAPTVRVAMCVHDTATDGKVTLVT